jgi:hypothetical protein
MAIKSITGILKKDSDKNYNDFLNEFVDKLNNFEQQDGTNKYLGIIYDLKNNTINIVPSDYLKNNENVQNQTFDLNLQNQLPELKITDISVSAIINSIFKGIEIPDGQILYVVGNDNKIEEKVYSGVIDDVLEKNKFNQFIIKYDGNSSVVYVRDDVDKQSVSDIINEFPYNYEILDNTKNKIATTIISKLKSNYETNLIIFLLKSNVSTIKNVPNLFEALNNDNEIVITYDSNNFTIYKNKKVDIEFLKNYKIII